MIPPNQVGPTRADEITKKVEGLSPAKRTLLDLRMKKKEVEGGIPHREGREKAALSFAQQRLWFLQQLETESPAYNVYGAVKLKGRLNEEALRGSLKEIVRRHETLRTRFVEVEGRAMQVVGDGAEVELPIIELSGVQERERETLRLAIEEASIPFDLGQGPLLRGKLLRLGEEEHVLLLIVHHIVSDGWSVGVLVRYSGQEELVVGTPIANRTRVETEELIGCFVNTLVLRVDASGNPRFCELLRRVKQVALEAYAHQDIPFEKLVEELQPKRDLSRTALFQVMFVLQNVPMAEMKLGGLTLSGVEFDHQVAKFDLTVTMWEAEEGLTGVVEYSTDLFEAGTMERLVGHWERLLEGIAKNAEQRVWELPLMGEAERRQVVEEWNQTEAWYPRDKRSVELIEEQVEKTPERVAVVYEGESLSYRELNRRANQLARRLRGWGVGPEQLVGLCMKRSLEMVVGLMGVLKAGGAYVPLEPDYPRERLEFMMRDTGVRVVLSEERYRKAVEGAGLRVWCLDTEGGDAAAVSGGGVASGVES